MIVQVLSKFFFETNNQPGVQTAVNTLFEDAWHVIRQHSIWLMNEHCNERNTCETIRINNVGDLFVLFAPAERISLKVHRHEVLACRFVCCQFVLVESQSTVVRPT